MHISKGRDGLVDTEEHPKDLTSAENFFYPLQFVLILLSNYRHFYIVITYLLFSVVCDIVQTSNIIRK